MGLDLGLHDWDLTKLLLVPALTVVLAGCGLSADRAVRAYDACVARHQQEILVCEGPRQAYEADTSTSLAKAAETGPTR